MVRTHALGLETLSLELPSQPRLASLGNCILSGVAVAFLRPVGLVTTSIKGVGKATVPAGAVI